MVLHRPLERGEDQAHGRLGCQDFVVHNPGSASASEQEAFLAQAVEDCRTHDIPLLVEPMTYHIVDGPKKGTAEFAKLKPEMVIETAP